MTLCNPLDCTLPASSVHGIFQAGILERILEWLAVSYSRRSSQPRDRTVISYISWIWRQILYHWTPGKWREHGDKIMKGLKVIVTIFLKRWSERTALKHVYHHTWNRSPALVWCMRQGTQGHALGWPWGKRWGGRWEGGSGWGTHVHPWLTHVNVWQKPLQYCN